MMKGTTVDKKRNYRLEYERYQGTPAQIKARSERNKARRILSKEGRVHKGDGMDVDHTRALSMGGSNSKSNLRVVSKHDNRSYPRGKRGQMLSNT